MGVRVNDPPWLELSFDTWVSTRVPELMRFAYLVTGSQDAAEEAVQTALSSACEKWTRVRRTTDPDAYVRRMIANAHVSQWRKFGKRIAVVSAVPEEWGGDPADSIATSDAVWRVCSALPRQQRAAVVLRFYEDLDYAEIALILEVAEATVRSHIHRALAALRVQLTRAED
jgi:RNA polymerase sigma-70 factor (sigma-E family)